MDDSVQVPTWVVQEVGRLQLELCAAKNLLAAREQQLVQTIASVAPHPNGKSSEPQEVASAEIDG